MSVQTYQCDGCGLCCAGDLIVEATPHDVLREPRIETAVPMPRKYRLNLLDRVWVLGCGKPCPFLRADKRCDIYATRPSDCVGFMAGSPKCQELREAHGLPRLAPMSIPDTTVNQITAQAVTYEIEHPGEM